MLIEELLKEAVIFLDGPANFIQAEDAIRPDIAGMRIFDAPLFGAARADDQLFQELRREDVVHPEVMLPHDWLPDARSVISFFLPFTDRVRRSNVAGAAASDEWVHARIEGQAAIAALCADLKHFIEERGFKAVVPASDSRFRLLGRFVSNWSERHAAYICGLGTFGLSRGLITEKGMAGRFGSIITDAETAPTPRKYTGPFDYCTMCGACQPRCPVGAIDAARGPAAGKDQILCGENAAATTRAPYGPKQIVRYGCGKCQVQVPCERGIPGKPAA